MSYFEDLAYDFRDLGLGQPSSEVTSHSELVAMLDFTERIDGTTYRPIRYKGRAMRTALGRTVIDLHSAGFTFAGERLDVPAACSVAEWKLAENITPEHVDDTNLRSPLIITHGSTPIVIAKGYGEPTCYGLVTEPSLGVVEGAFCYSGTVPNPRSLAPIQGAYTYELPLTEPFVPLRMSAFAIPLAERGGIPLEKQEEVLRKLSHADILRRAVTLQKTARPVPS